MKKMLNGLEKLGRVRFKFQVFGHIRLAVVSLLILLVGVFALLSAPPSVAKLGLQSYQGSTTSIICIATGESGLTLHVVDINGSAVASATALLNGTYVDSGQVCLSNLSGTTNSDGNAAFTVVGGAKYNVTVIPPKGFAGASIVVAEITAPPPTMFTTITIAPYGSTTLTLENAASKFPVPSELALIAAILLAIILATVMVKRRKSRRVNKNWKEKPKEKSTCE